MDFPKIDIPSLFSPVYGKLRKYDEDLAKILQLLMSNLSRIFEGGISIPDSLDLETVTVTTDSSADTEFSVAHTLKRVPVGYLVVSRDKGGVVYDSGTAFTITTIYLKCTTTSTVIKVLIF